MSAGFTPNSITCLNLEHTASAVPYKCKGNLPQRTTNWLSVAISLHWEHLSVSLTLYNGAIVSHCQSTSLYLMIVELHRHPWSWCSGPLSCRHFIATSPYNRTFVMAPRLFRNAINTFLPFLISVWDSRWYVWGIKQCYTQTLHNALWGSYSGVAKSTIACCWSVFAWQPSVWCTLYNSTTTATWKVVLLSVYLSIFCC